MMTDCLAPQRSESDYFLLENWTQRTQTRTTVHMNAYDCLSLLPLLTSYHTQVFEETVKLNLNLTCLIASVFSHQPPWRWPLHVFPLAC